MPDCVCSCTFPKKRLFVGYLVDLLSFSSQLVTLAFQSQVCFIISKARPEGHWISFKPDLVHLKTHKKWKISWVFFRGATAKLSNGGTFFSLFQKIYIHFSFGAGNRITFHTIFADIPQVKEIRSIQELSQFVWNTSEIVAGT